MLGCIDNALLPEEHGIMADSTTSRSAVYIAAGTYTVPGVQVALIDMAYQHRHIMVNSEL